MGGYASIASRPERLPVVLVTGLSGAGHTTALKILEDLGYEAVDNLPLTLMDGLAGGKLARPLAVGVDSRTRDFSAEALIERLRLLTGDSALEVKLLFLDCSDEVLRRRFTETRRRHPLALDRPVADGIRQERELLDPLREHADLVVDSTDLAIGDLKHLLQGHFRIRAASAAAITVMSFSYRHGLPREADLVFDARFLSNPHYRDELRPLSGKDEPVARFIEADPAWTPFFAALGNLLLPLLPRFEREGKSYLTLAVGCTGGRHRSVFTAERLAQWLREQGRHVSLRHRDLDRGAGADR
ncbi:nucleotide-binding protein [Hypericibacter terrae]|uniref:Nucleotide-binding protein n=1 Tax=Hypericibacter terrae TaxID=2602015 RepID=A0A5J6MJI7_9PROT|nr:nucleotide-binding protein [Hypericibacter terrae]